MVSIDPTYYSVPPHLNKISVSNFMGFFQWTDYSFLWSVKNLLLACLIQRCSAWTLLCYNNLLHIFLLKQETAEKLQLPHSSVAPFSPDKSIKVRLPFYFFMGKQLCSLIIASFFFRGCNFSWRISKMEMQIVPNPTLFRRKTTRRNPWNQPFWEVPQYTGRTLVVLPFEGKGLLYDPPQYPTWLHHNPLWWNAILFIVQVH